MPPPRKKFKTSEPMGVEIKGAGKHQKCSLCRLNGQTQYFNLNAGIKI